MKRTIKQENQKLKETLLLALDVLMILAADADVPAEKGRPWFDIGLKIHNLFPNEPICKDFRELIRQ